MAFAVSITASPTSRTDTSAGLTKGDTVAGETASTSLDFSCGWALMGVVNAKGALPQG